MGAGRSQSTFCTPQFDGAPRIRVRRVQIARRRTPPHEAYNRSTSLPGLPVASLALGLPVASLALGLPVASLALGLPVASLALGLPVAPRAAGPTMRDMRAEAIVLAGGRGSRMGGVDKPAIVVGGRSMLTTVLAALDWCETVAVVGPHRDDLPAGVLQTQEHPPGAGPVAAIAAGIAALPGNADLVAVVAADLPLLRDDAVRELARECADSGTPVAFAVDDAGRVQYLVGVWRHDVLARQLAAVGSTANRRMQDLVPDGAAKVTLDGILDCDTPDDLARLEPGAAVTLEVARESRPPQHFCPADPGRSGRRRARRSARRAHGRGRAAAARGRVGDGRLRGRGRATLAVARRRRVRGRRPRRRPAPG